MARFAVATKYQLGFARVKFWRDRRPYGETIVRQVRYLPLTNTLLGRSARLDDPWPYAFHLVRLNRRRSLQSDLQGLHCHYGTRTRELSGFPPFEQRPGVRLEV
jgi:hypothetical protein